MHLQAANEQNLHHISRTSQLIQNQINAGRSRYRAQVEIGKTDNAIARCLQMRWEDLYWSHGDNVCGPRSGPVDLHRSFICMFKFASICPYDVDWDRYLKFVRLGFDHMFWLLSMLRLVPNYHARQKVWSSIYQHCLSCGVKLHKGYCIKVPVSAHLQINKKTCCQLPCHAC
eukprot:7300136-Karenia_brevis.AAC.1